MDIISVEIENFLSFGPKQTVYLDNTGLVLVEGVNLDEPKASSNGAGKSALLESISWCLFGKTLRGLKGDEVINRKVGKGCCVVVRGRDSTGELWESRRFRKVKGKNGFEFYVNGRDLTPHGDPQHLQSEVDKHLMTNYDLFNNTAVFGQSAKWRFTELSDKAQKALLEQILGVEDLSAAHDHVKAKLSEITGSLTIVETDIRINDIKLEAKYETLRAAKESAEVVRARDIKRYTDEIRAIKEAIADLEDTDLPVTAIHTVLETQKSELERELQEAKEHCGVTLQKTIRDSVYTYRVAQRDVKDINDLLQGGQEQLRVAKDAKVGTVCDDCGSRLSSAMAKKRVIDLKDDCEGYSIRLKLLEDCLVDAKNAMDNLLNVEEPSATAKIKDLESDLSQINSDIVDYITARDAIKLEKGKLRKAKLNRKAAKDEVLRPNPRMLKESQDLESLIDQDKAKLECLEDSRDLYKFWVEGFGNGGVKSHLLDHVVPILNKRARQYSQHLMEGVEITFSAQKRLKSGELRDKFDITVTNSHGAEGYTGNSGGEKRKIDIIVARALQSLEEDRSKMVCNLSWWDEVFESLDETSCEAVMSMLREEAKARPSVLVISHLDWLKTHFTKVLRVTKCDGFSKVAWV